MSEDDRLNLYALDPMQDPARWRGVVNATLERVDAVLAQRPQDPLSMITSWTRPLLVAGAVVVALLIPMEIALQPREAQAERVQRLVALSADWDHGEQPPTGSDFLRALAAGERP